MLLHIQKWIAFIVILLFILITIVPKASIQETFINPSFYLYKNESDESEFYKKLYGLNSTEFKEELLWMDRCIKIPMSYNLNSFISKAKFPIQYKKLYVSSYKDIETTVMTELKNFYLNNRLKTLHGPVYVLMGQAPKLTVVDETCTSRPLSVQFTTLPNNLKGLSSYNSISNECQQPNISSNISIYVYLLFPTYNKKAQFVYRSWENIKCHLSDLLAHRSKEYPCFLNCMTNPNMTCGCINQRRPYKSTCLGDNEQGLMDSIQYNYWNLFIVNTSYVNQVFNANLDSPFFSESVEIKPFDTNLQYCGSNKPILEMNKELNAIELKSQERYRITHIPTGKCLDDVPLRTTEKIDTCVSKENQYWVAESVPGKEGFYLKNVMTNRYLKASLNTMTRKVILQTVQKYSFTNLQRWKYVDYQLELLDPIENTTLGTNNYLYMIDNKLTISTLNNNPNLSTSLPGILIGVGTDYHLRTKTRLTDSWIKVDSSMNIIKVHVLKNGLIVGVGTNYNLYTKQRLTSPWVLVSSSENTFDITQLLDGNLLILKRPDHLMYIKRDLYSPAVKLEQENTYPMRCIHVMSNGILLGVHLHNNHMYTKDTLTSPWRWVNPSCCVYDAYELPSKMILGVGTNYHLYTKTSLTASWSWVDKGCCLVSIAFLENKADIMDSLSKTWIVEPISQATTVYRDMDENIDNRDLRKYLLSL